MAEYGDPDIPEQWAYIAKYSPYQNVRKDVRYPPTLFVTSTRDDRVHPAHARKMFARMQEQGHDAWYYENIEGGHGAASNNEQRALMAAIEYTFLWKTPRRQAVSAASMRAIEISQPGGPEVLRLTERPVPQPADGEVLIRVQAAGVNRPDVLQRKGAYAPPAGASDLPGLEVSGTIESGDVQGLGFQDRRRGVRAGCRRRVRRVLRRTGRAMPAEAARAVIC